MRLNRVRILARLARAPCPQWLGRGMGHFCDWGVKRGCVEPTLRGNLRITDAGREALRRSVAEYERHGWMGHVGMSKEKLGGKK